MDAETGQGVVGVLGHGRGGEHVLTLTFLVTMGNNHVHGRSSLLLDGTPQVTRAQ